MPIGIVSPAGDDQPKGQDVEVPDQSDNDPRRHAPKNFAWGKITGRAEGHKHK